MNDTPDSPPPNLPQLGLSNALLLEDEKDTKSELDKIIEMILDDNNIAHNTELSANEVKAFSALRAFVKKHENLTMLKNYLVERMVLSVSKSRKGRQELIKILNRQMESQYMQMPGGGMGPPGAVRRGGWFRR
jgi:hypothetical protein